MLGNLAQKILHTKGFGPGLGLPELTSNLWMDGKNKLFTNLRFASSETGGTIEIAYRIDAYQHPEIPIYLQRGWLLRLRILSGSGIECRSAPTTSPVCVVRIFSCIRGLVQDLATPTCSTPIKKGCSLNANPLWNFECGFFLQSISDSIVEFSIWNAESPCFANRRANWEDTNEFLLYISGCLSTAFIGTAFLNLHDVIPCKTVHRELSVVTPTPTSAGLYACCHIQACLRMVFARAIYQRLRLDAHADVLYQIQVAARQCDAINRDLSLTISADSSCPQPPGSWRRQRRGADDILQARGTCIDQVTRGTRFSISIVSRSGTAERTADAACPPQPRPHIRLTRPAGPGPLWPAPRRCTVA